MKTTDSKPGGFSSLCSQLSSRTQSSFNVLIDVGSYWAANSHVSERKEWRQRALSSKRGGLRHTPVEFLRTSFGLFITWCSDSSRFSLSQVFTLKIKMVLLQLFCFWVIEGLVGIHWFLKVVQKQWNAVWKIATLFTSIQNTVRFLLLYESLWWKKVTECEFPLQFLEAFFQQAELHKNLWCTYTRQFIFGFLGALDNVSFPQGGKDISLTTSSHQSLHRHNFSTSSFFSPAQETQILCYQSLILKCTLAWIQSQPVAKLTAVV